MRVMLHRVSVRLATGLLLLAVLVGGLVAVNLSDQQALAHDQYVWVPMSGSGRNCPASLSNCRLTWTHVNRWTRYKARVPAGCTIATLGTCGITISSSSYTSSCSNTNNCGHGPHSSTPKSTGAGSWTVWSGHHNTNYRWSGNLRAKLPHTHAPSPTAAPQQTPQPTSQQTPQPTSGPTPRPIPTSPGVSISPPPPKPPVTPGTINFPRVNPCAIGGCVPSCVNDNIPNNCPWENPDKKPNPNNPSPPQKVCKTSWPSSQTQKLRQALRWESIVPYSNGYGSKHHSEVPGGQHFLTAASGPKEAAKHWVALKSGTNLNVVDALTNGCKWQATEVGVTLRELLPHWPADLRTLHAPGNVAAASHARQAAQLWQRLSQQRQQWYIRAFPRSDPATVWCSPGALPQWTEPASKALSLDSRWRATYDRCRWLIPRQGFWRWQLVIKYVSETGDLHTRVVAEDISWFREANGYLTKQVTLW